MMKSIAILLLTTVQVWACSRHVKFNNPVTPGTVNISIATDKAVYAPGETVRFTLSAVPGNTVIRYRYLSTILQEEAITASSWNWQPPTDDFRGYLAEVCQKQNNTEKTLATIAVDVSSSWNKFPRYGFLSKFGPVAASKMDSVVTSLARHHINGIQFYDWHDKHHQPLAGTVAHPAESWKDIANRESLKTTVEGYIDRVHQKGMQAMFYNLCYGALSDAAADGVQPQHYMFRDAAHTIFDKYTLPKPLFKSDIYFTDPSNPSWQQYIVSKNSDVYQVYQFDGYHIDQVGNRDGVLYNYKGEPIDLPAGFHSFIEAMKTAHPSKKLVFNAVNQYGQEGNIATAPVDFLYTEVWAPNEGYKDLARVIQDNLQYSNGKPSVLAAYMNYEKGSNPGYFNTPAVLLTNAVIFAFGGSHLELGEHMLCKEYFPNDNLKMSDELSNSITAYYDFLTAYENLLRDGGSFNSPAVNCVNGAMTIGTWPPQSGKVAVQGKQVGGRQILHLINFAKAASFDWRDTNGTQQSPDLLRDAAIELNYPGTVHKVWVASPDLAFGAPKQLPFTQNGGVLKFTLPELKYWDMVVIE